MSACSSNTFNLLYTYYSADGSLEGQTKQTKEEMKESLQRKRSTGEMKVVGEAESRKSSDQKNVESADMKNTKGESKRNLDEKAQFKTNSSLSGITYSPEQSPLHNLAGRSAASTTKESKRTSPASSKIDMRKRSFIEMAPGLSQLERKISILEAKFESLSAAPTNLEIVQQARDLQSRESSTTAAGDMWQAMNLVRRIEVAEGAIDGITAMLDDINEQLKKMKENCPDGSLKGLSNKLGKSDELQAKVAEIDEKLRNTVHKTDLKPYITVKKMNEMMEYKLQNYRQLSPTVPKSPKKTISSKLAQTELIETSSQPAQTSPTQEASSDEPAQPVTSGELADETRSTEQQQTEQEATTESDDQVPAKSTTPNSEQAAPETTATTPFSERAGSEEADYDGTAHSEAESVYVESYRTEERGDERRGSLTTEAFEELCMTMQSWCDFREEAAQKIRDLEECLSNTVDKNSLLNLEQELKNLAEVQSTLKNSQEQVENELNRMSDRPLVESIASQQDLTKLETSVDGQLHAFTKNLQEMKQNFFQLYEMKETIGCLKESEDQMKSDIDHIRREIMKIIKQMEDEQGMIFVFCCKIVTFLTQGPSSKPNADSDWPQLRGLAILVLRGALKVLR